VAPSRLTTEDRYPNTATPLGSDLYYAIRYAPPDTRDDLALLAAVYARLFQIPAECSEPAVALRKAGWWRDELERSVTGGRSEHPLGESLARLFERRLLPPHPLFDMADAIIAEIRRSPFTDTAGLIAHWEQGQGALCELFTHILSPAPPDTLVCKARRLGGLIGMATAIQDMGAHLRAGRCLLPKDLMAAYGVQCAIGIEPESATALMSRLADAARSHGALSATPTNRRLLPVLIQAQLAETLLGEMEKAGFPVIGQRVALTPLYKLWLSWRLYRTL